MNIRDLEIVIAVAKFKNISIVAKNLFISQPALSQKIKSIEEELQTDIFKRTGHGIELTEKGHIVIKYMKDMFNTHQNMLNQLKHDGTYSKGHIVLGITNYLGSMILPKLLTRFRDAYPNIEIDVLEDTSRNMDQHILDGRVDLAILHKPLHQTPYQIVPLSTSSFVVAVSKNHRLAKSQLSYVDPILLKNEEFIALMPDQRIRQISDSICIQRHFTPKIKLITKSFETARNLVFSGYGISLLPKDYLDFFYTKNNPVCLNLIPDIDYTWTTCIAHSATTPLSVNSKAFIEYTLNFFKEDQL